MPKWFNLNKTELYQRFDQVYPSGRIPDEDDPLFSVEYDLGLRIFKRGSGQFYAKDLLSNVELSVDDIEKALDNLRDKIQAN